MCSLKCEKSCSVHGCLWLAVKHFEWPVRVEMHYISTSPFTVFSHLIHCYDWNLHTAVCQTQILGLCYIFMDLECWLIQSEYYDGITLNSEAVFNIFTKHSFQVGKDVLKTSIQVHNLAAMWPFWMNRAQNNQLQQDAAFLCWSSITSHKTVGEVIVAMTTCMLIHRGN